MLSPHLSSGTRTWQPELTGRPFHLQVRNLGRPPWSCKEQDAIRPDSRFLHLPHSSLACLLPFPLPPFRIASFLVPPTHVPFSSLLSLSLCLCLSLALSPTETKRSGLQVRRRAGRLCFRNPTRPSISPAPAAPKGDSCAVWGASSQSSRPSEPCEHPPFLPLALHYPQGTWPPSSGSLAS